MRIRIFKLVFYCKSNNKVIQIQKSVYGICRIKNKTYLCNAFEKNKCPDDSLAQLVEHNTFNVGVLGSSPRRITFKIFKALKINILSAFLLLLTK